MTFYSVTCPQCQKNHQVPEDYLKDKDARLVKCAQCQHVWRYLKKSGFFNTSRLRFPFSTPPLSATYDYRGKIQHHSLYSYKWRRFFIKWGSLSILLVASFFLFKKDILSIPPEFSQKAYAFLDKTKNQAYHFIRSFLTQSEPAKEGITLNVLTSHLSIINGEPTLRIKGEVINHSHQDIDLPVITIKLMDTNDKGNGELDVRHSWLYKLENMPLRAGEHRFFETTGNCLQNKLPSTVTLHFNENE